MSRTLRHFLDAIKFEHTVFALPFAYVAMVLAARGWPGTRVVVWVTVAMAAARASTPFLPASVSPPPCGVRGSAISSPWPLSSPSAS